MHRLLPIQAGVPRTSPEVCWTSKLQAHVSGRHSKPMHWIGYTGGDLDASRASVSGIRMRMPIQVCALCQQWNHRTCMDGSGAHTARTRLPFLGFRWLNRPFPISKCGMSISWTTKPKFLPSHVNKISIVHMNVKNYRGEKANSIFENRCWVSKQV